MEKTKKKDITDFKFIVTNDDYLKAIPGDPCQCAAARAIKRTLKTKEKVSVGSDEITIGIETFSTPQVISDMIDLFDEEIRFEGCEIIERIDLSSSFEEIAKSRNKVLQTLRKELDTAINNKKSQLKPIKFSLKREEDSEEDL